MVQYGFFFDQSRCIGCYSCAVACKDWNDIPPGPSKWLRIHQYETGSFPNVRLNIVPVFCYHCEKPICLENCPSGAIYKEEKYGTNRDLKDMPSSITTKPSIIQKPMAAKKTLVPYPVQKAIDLMGGDATAISQGTAKPDKLLLKPKDTEELRRQILDHDG